MRTKRSAAANYWVLIPILVLALSAYLAYGQVVRRKAAETEAQALDVGIASSKKLLADMQSQPIIDKEFAVEATAEEQAAFLDLLRVYADAAGANVSKFVNLPPPPANQQQQQREPKPKVNITPISTTVEVQGRFDQVRAFAYSLIRTKRLLNMDNVRWRRDQNGPVTTLSFTVTRYVIPPAPKATPPANPAPTGTPAAGQGATS